MKELLLDIERTSLLLWTILKFSLGPIIRFLLRLPSNGENYTVRIRLAMEEMGLTYLKLGQFLATRHDILPEEICRELNKLFEEVPPMPFADVRAMVESELAGQLEVIFPFFNQEPIGAASVAQVHEARTVSGERVAVKVQRPDIERIFTADMRIVRRGARLVDRLRLLGRLSATEAVDEFATWTFREMNFLNEGRTADRLRKSAQPYEKVPRIFWELTTPRVLTLEYADGISVAQVAHLIAQGGVELVRSYLPGFDLEQTVHNLAFASLNQLYGIGFFHGDPHPGNILLGEANTVIFVDFGIFGSLTEYEREVVVGLAENTALGNIEESFRYYFKELIPTEETDLRTFEREAKTVLRQWHLVALRLSSVGADSAAAPRHLGRYIGEMIAISRRNQLQMGRRYLLFWRAMNALDATILQLSAEFDLLGEMQRYFGQTRPPAIQRILQVLSDQSRVDIAADLAQSAPGQIRNTLSGLAHGTYRWPVEIDTSRSVQRSQDTDAKWLIAAVLGVSLAVLVAGVPLPGIVGSTTFVVALVLCSVAIVSTVVRARGDRT
jgi:ubiquinone biosynthesis protein